MSKLAALVVSTTDQERLERLVRDRNTPQKVVWRSRIVLLAAAGLSAVEIAAATSKSLLTVRRWRRCFEGQGVEGLMNDATRPSRIALLSKTRMAEMLEKTLHTKPPNATH